MKLIEINCQDVQEDLSVGSKMTEATRRHLEICGECARFQSGLDNLSRFTHNDVAATPRPELKANIKTAIDTSTPMYRKSLQLKRKPLFAVCWAATLIVLAVLINGVSRMNVLISPPPTSFVKPTIDDAKWKQVMAHTVGGPKGRAAARYTVVEFGDFACPQCALIHRQFDSLPTVAPVCLYFVNRPFPKLRGHENALVAAEASLAAEGQGKFWPMFDALYDHHDALDPSNYERYAAQVGIDGARLWSDIESGKYHEQAVASSEFCDGIGMTMTPAIVVRDNENGIYQVAAGRNEIDKLLQREGWATSAQ